MSKQHDVAIAIRDVIGEQNIISYTNCMTRLRIKAKPNFDTAELKKIPGVLGLVSVDDEFQIVLGPGFVNKVALEFSKIVSAEKTEFDEKKMKLGTKSLADIAKDEKSKVRGKNKFQSVLTKISKVFMPLIPAFIGAGLLSGIAGIMASTVDNNFLGHETLQSWNNILTIMLTVLSNVFVIAVGWGLGKEFGGNPGISALMAAIYCSFFGSIIIGIFIPLDDGTFSLLGIHIKNIKTNWLTVGFVNLDNAGVAKLGAPHAGLIGGIISAVITIQIEKLFRRFMPGAIDTIITPIIVIFIMIFLNLLLIIPIAGYIFTGVTWLFVHVYQNPFGAALLAGIFLIALVFGVHQGFLPVYYALIDQTGVNGLFPIMCMGGVAQVGVSIMLWILAGKGSILRKQISGAIIPGFLGIGEPLVYGISLPRIKPFVAACFAGAIGGFYIGAMNAWGHIGLGMNSPTGPGGLTAAIMMTTIDGNVVAGVLTYLSAVLITYVVGALLCWFAYSKIALNGSKETVRIYKEENYCSIGQKIGYTLCFITVIGLYIFWIAKYYSLSKEQKHELKAYRIE
ncbi:PTS transporter subunit EIIC [Spiroplasma endosymbiont of Labia minor]|uniref:PTS transporter subunit EIIC n=1 Tax=Spiroplasma endosymbiont of Labia minor TaxID=3066305 RepID=UPI0030CE66DF